MEYVVVEFKRGDCFTEEFDNPGDAIIYGNRRMREMGDYDKKICEELVLLRSADPDIDSEDHLEGDIVRRWI